jgi:hypothetical protein
LTLIEALTGDVPFSADTTLGTLMARVERTDPVPESLGALREPLEAAGRADPESRPDAAEFAALLMKAANALDRPDPLPLAGAMPTEVLDLEDRDPTTQFISERSLVGIPSPTSCGPAQYLPTTSHIIEEGEAQPGSLHRHQNENWHPTPAPKERRRQRRAGMTSGRQVARRQAPTLAMDHRSPSVGARRSGQACWCSNVRWRHVVPDLVNQTEADVAPLIADGQWTVERTETGPTARCRVRSQPGSAAGTHLKETARRARCLDCLCRCRRISCTRR